MVRTLAVQKLYAKKCNCNYGCGEKRKRKKANPSSWQYKSYVETTRNKH